MFHYFAYGSNILTSRIEERIGKVKKIENLRLYGWKLLFNCGWNCAYANIVKGKETDFIEGVVYEISIDQLLELNVYEGYPQNYVIEHIEYNGRNIFFYKATRLFEFSAFWDLVPTKQYLNLIIKGCKEHGLEYTYNKLKKLKNKLYDGSFTGNTTGS